MIGTGLKKLANENGMKVANGLAYGTFRGYSAAFWFWRCLPTSRNISRLC